MSDDKGIRVYPEGIGNAKITGYKVVHGACRWVIRDDRRVLQQLVSYEVVLGDQPKESEWRDVPLQDEID